MITLLSGLEPSDYSLVLDLLLALALMVYFAAGKPRVWYRDRLGWVLFGYAAAVSALLLLIVYGIVFGQKVDEPYRLVVGIGLAIAFVAKIRAIHIERKLGREANQRPEILTHTGSLFVTKEDTVSNDVVPAATKLAAKRGFIRTTSQSISTALAGGLSATVIISTLTAEPNWLALGITAGVTVVSPFLAGAASYFSILSRGIPEDYVQPGVQIQGE